MIAPRRRWSFSMRMIFVAVALLCAVLAWLQSNAARVAHRKAVTAKIESRGGWVALEYPITVPECAPCLKPASVIPALRRWLGDEPAAYVTIRSESDSLWAREAFPETNEFWIEPQRGNAYLAITAP